MGEILIMPKDSTVMASAGTGITYTALTDWGSTGKDLTEKGSEKIIMTPKGSTVMASAGTGSMFTVLIDQDSTKTSLTARPGKVV